MKIKYLINNVCLLGLALCLSLAGCRSSEDETEDGPAGPVAPVACFSSGDVLVSNSGSDAVVAFDSAGNFKGIIYSVSTTAGESIYGLDYMESTGEIVVVVDGADRVMAINPEGCVARMLIADANLNGNLRGITQLSTGDLLVVETSSIERFSSTGNRITAGAWPKTLQTTSTEINAIPTGGFVLCSSGADVVRTYSDAGVQIATRASGIAATTDGVGCRALNNGQIVTAWSGTTDSVVFYSSNLSSALHTYSDISVLATPGGIGERANGSVLVVDRAFHHVVEISGTGTFVRTFGNGYLNVPEHVLVIP